MKTIDRDIAFNSYLECAVWDSVESMDDTLGIDDFNSDTIVAMRKEFNDFCAQVETLELVDLPDFISDEMLGYDFWMTRSGAGAGFWDGDWGSLGSELTDMSQTFGKRDLYIGDDGEIYSS